MDLKPHEIKLAAKLLELAGDKFSNHGSNDFDLVSEAGLTTEEACEVNRAYVQWNEEEDDYSEEELNVTHAIAGDDGLMMYLSERLASQLKEGDRGLRECCNLSWEESGFSMKELKIESLLSPDQLFGLTEQWLILNIDANKRDDEAVPQLYTQQVNCKIGQINLRSLYSVAHLYFEVRPIIKSDDVEVVANYLVIGKNSQSGRFYLYIYVGILDMESGEQIADYSIPCSAVFAVSAREGDRT